jgi:hypothetical protein
MRALVLSLLASLLSAALRADFSYQDTTTVTGGALYNALHSTVKNATGATVSTRLLKGNRMAEVTKERTTVIDLEKQTITRIDIAKKTYSVITFEQMKEALHNAEVAFKVSVKPTGQTKYVGVLTGRETILTIQRDTAATDSDAMTIVVDAWMVIVPGYDEVRTFSRKLGEKMGYAFDSGILSLATGRAEAIEGFGEGAKETNKVEGAPVQRTVKIVVGSEAGAPEAALPAPFPPDPHSNPAAAAASVALGRLRIGHKKISDQPASSSGSLLETLTELSEFSLAPIGASKFEVPAGFKQVPAEGVRSANREPADKN